MADANQLPLNPDLEAVGDDIGAGKYSLQSLISDPNPDRRLIGNEFVDYMRTHYNTDLTPHLQQPNLAANVPNAPATDNPFMENLAHNANLGTGALMERLGANAVQGYQQMTGDNAAYDPMAVQNAMSSLEKQREAYTRSNPWASAAGTVAGNLPAVALMGTAAAGAPTAAGFALGPDFSAAGSGVPNALKAAQLFTSGAGIGDVAKTAQELGDVGQVPSARELVVNAGKSGALNTVIPSLLMGGVNAAGLLATPTLEKAGQALSNVPEIQNALNAITSRLSALKPTQSTSEIYSPADMATSNELTDTAQQLVEKHQPIIIRHMEDVTSRPEIQDAFPNLYTPSEIQGANTVRAVAEGGEEPENEAILQQLSSLKKNPRVMSLVANPNAPTDFFQQDIPGVVYNEALKNVGVNARNINTPLRNEQNIMEQLRDEQAPAFGPANKAYSTAQTISDISDKVPGNIFSPAGTTEKVPGAYFDLINSNEFKNLSPAEQENLLSLANQYNNQASALGGNINPLVNKYDPSNNSMYHPMKAVLSGLMGMPHAMAYHGAMGASGAAASAAQGALGNTLRELTQQYYLGNQQPLLDAIAASKSGIGQGTSDLADLIGQYMGREYPVATSEKK